MNTTSKLKLWLRLLHKVIKKDQSEHKDKQGLDNLEAKY